MRGFRWLWTAIVLFTLYATTIPFNFVHSSVEVREHVVLAAGRSALSQLPRLSRTDVLQNVLLFVPFGIVAVGSLSSRRTFAAILVATVSAATISAMCEALQLLTTDRVSSLWDVWANTAGAAFGSSGAVAGRHAWRASARQIEWRRLASESVFPLVCAVVLVCVAAGEPFDFTLDVGSVWSKAKPFVHGTWLVWQPVTDDALTAVRFAIVAVLGARWMRSLGVKPTRARLLAMASSAMLAIALETTQFFIASRAPAVQDVLDGLAGVLAGTLAIPYLAAQTSMTPWLIVVTVAAAVPFYLEPFVLAREYSSINFFPFLAYYQLTSLQTVSHVLDLMLIYAPIGFVISWQMTPRPLLRAAITSGLVASVLEYGQGWVVGRFPDLTDIAMAILGGVVGAAIARWGRQLIREGSRSSASLA